MSYRIYCLERHVYTHDDILYMIHDPTRRPSHHLRQPEFTQIDCDWIESDNQQPGCALIDLPEQCVVYWTGDTLSRRRGEIRATSTTTYGELYDQSYGPDCDSVSD